VYLAFTIFTPYAPCKNNLGIMFTEYYYSLSIHDRNNLLLFNQHASALGTQH